MGQTPKEASRLFRFQEIEVTNGQIRSLRARINKVNEWLYAVPLDSIAPTMAQMLNGVNSGAQLQSQWQRIRDLQTRAKLLIFCQENGVYDIADLAATVRRMHERQYNVAGKLKKVKRRLDTLTEHLAHYENLKEHLAVYQKYRQLDPKKRDAYYKKHDIYNMIRY